MRALLRTFVRAASLWTIVISSTACIAASASLPNFPPCWPRLSKVAKVGQLVAGSLSHTADIPPFASVSVTLG